MTETTDGQKVIRKIAEVAAAMGDGAGEPAQELAGHIVSFLYANPEELESFMEEGTLYFLNREHGTKALFESGALSYRARNGQIMTPSELRKHKGTQQ